MTGDDEGYQNFIDESVDPGNSLLIGTLTFCVLLIAVLPCVISVGMRFRNHEEVADTDTAEAPKAQRSSRIQGGGAARSHVRELIDDDYADAARCAKTGASDIADAFVDAILGANPHGGTLKRPHQFHIMHRDERLERFKNVEFDDDNQSAVSNSFLGPLSHDEVSIRDAVDASELVYDDALDLMKGIDSPAGPWYSRLITCYDKLLVIAEWDYETRRIVKLGGPFVLQALLVGISETVRVALISRFIGTAALSAYIVVTLAVGTTNVFIKGLQYACTPLCSQAIGAGNKRLAGQYIQIATILFTICYIPLFIMWTFSIGGIFSWLGFDDAVRKIGEQFARLFLTASFFQGISQSLHALLDVIGRQNYSTAVILCREIVSTLATLAAALQPGASNLQLVGLLFIALEVLALVLNVFIILRLGWFELYLDGLIGSVAIFVRCRGDANFVHCSAAIFVLKADFVPQNTKATKLLLKTSVPLSLGGLIAFGEWEILTIFAR